MQYMAQQETQNEMVAVLTAMAVIYASKNKRNIAFLILGESRSFEVKFKCMEDYRIDLYYLRDLFFSIEDDLPNVKNLGVDLMDKMRKTTSDFRMGLSQFSVSFYFSPEM